MWRINNTFGYAVKCGHIAGQERPIFEACAARLGLETSLAPLSSKTFKEGGGLEHNLCLCHSNPLLTASKDPCKELLLEGIELTDVLFVSAVMGFALRHPQSRQLLALSFDKVGVGNIEHPCCSTEK